MRRGRVTIVTTVSGSQELRLRRAGRVIVLDPEDRVLLFRYDEAPPNGRHWCTPGGGLDDGEDYPAGARRELTGVTGWTDVPIRTRGLRARADHGVRGRDGTAARAVLPGPGGTGRRGLGEVAAMHVSDGIAAWHWWTLAELDATDELVCAGGPGRPDQVANRLKSQGRRLMPLTKLDSSRSGSPAVMSGTRVSSSRSITLSSRRARWAPRQ